MSRLIKKPLVIPSGVTAAIRDGKFSARGPLGEVEVPISTLLDVAIEGANVKIVAKRELKKNDKALLGTMYRLILNAVEGASRGFSKVLEVNGVGFKVAVSGQKLTMSLGYSHPVEFVVPSTLKVSVEKNVITLTGADKQLVGEIAAQIRKLRKPEPYKGTGIKYNTEVIRRKAGKQVKAGAG